MKIAFSVSGDELDSILDSRFGRAQKFLVYDLDNDTFQVVDNRLNLNAAQGAGIQSAEAVVRLGVKAVVTGHCGPKAFRVLSAAGVKVYNADEVKVSEALSQYRDRTLKEAVAADVEGHWA